MHNLEQSIAGWRKSMAAAPRLAPESLDELENHLRETVEELLRSGVAENEAFQRALTQFGTPHAVAAEFQKLNAPAWLPAKVLTGVAVAVALTLLVFLARPWLAASPSPGASILLAAHVFTVTLGYTTALLLGILGICFVCQRCLADFPPQRLESISRASFHFAWIAAVLTVVGVVLGMIWTKREWGRFWGWDPKEIGGLGVSVWLICFVAVTASRRMGTRGVLVSSVLSSNFVSLAWFGPGLLSPGLHHYGMPNYSWLLLAAVISNLLLFLVGLAPAGWLCRRRAA